MRGEEPRHVIGRFEMAFGIHFQSEARFGKGAFLADAGEHIGKAAAFWRMIERIIDGDERASTLPGEFGKKAQSARRIAMKMIAGAEEDAGWRFSREASKARREAVIEQVRRHCDQYLAVAGAQYILEA